MRTNLLLLMGLLASAAASASGGADQSGPLKEKWRAECGACHVAYPARMLPAASWKALMGGLDKHFGSDASLDPGTTLEILSYLESNASRRKTGPFAKPVLRITQTRWFIHEHNAVPARLWKDARVKSAANCAACHTRAEQGDFSERNLQVPR